MVRRAVRALTDGEARPILVHCLNGQQTTGCIVGLLRRVENWALSAIFDEYRRHVSGGRVHALDLQMIELWQPEQLLSTDEDEDDGGAEEAPGESGDGDEGAEGSAPLLRGGGGAEAREPREDGAREQDERGVGAPRADSPPGASSDPGEATETRNSSLLSFMT